MTEPVFDRESLEAIGELLALGEQLGFGITFVPDEQGWVIGYMRGMGGGTSSPVTTWAIQHVPPCGRCTILLNATSERAATGSADLLGVRRCGP
jgi:hypothetical protein